MKKIIVLLITVIFITGCTKSDISSVTKSFSDDVNNSNSYELLANMKIYGDEEEYNYDLNVLYKKDKFYRVELSNLDNKHRQIILKNEDGVYV
ncbi:MAG: hypothetical protein K6G37_02900 [Bacilli bacterium]|nr:hypothetical protein [Bacilli bacterium]